MSFVLYSEHINVGDRSLRQCVTFACDRNVKARIYNSKEKQKIRFDFHDDDDDGARRDIFRRLLLFLQNSRTTIFFPFPWNTRNSRVTVDFDFRTIIIITYTSYDSGSYLRDFDWHFGFRSNSFRPSSLYYIIL